MQNPLSIITVEVPEGGKSNIVMPTFTPSTEQIAKYRDDGFFIAERLLDAEEVDLLKSIARADHQMQSEAASRGDGEGGSIRLVVENELHDDI